jgi:hypothetical protein
MAEISDDTASAKECRVCLVEHDEDIHAATLSVHKWYRGYVTRYFVAEEIEELDEQFVA